MNVHTVSDLNSRINAYLSETGPVSTVTLKGFADTFLALPDDDRKKRFQQMRIWKIREEFAQRRFVSLLFCLGEKLEWQQSHVFRHLKHSWEQNSNDAGYADMMLRCLSELNLRS